MSTLSGITLSGVIVVDDPHGYCVSSEDVLIVGRKAVMLPQAIDMGWILKNPGVPLRRDYVIGDAESVLTVRPAQTRYRNARNKKRAERKVKINLNGLRP